MAGKMLSVEPTIDPSAAVRESTLGALPDFRKLAVEDFPAKYEATSSGFSHSKRRSATSWD
jgi:hypothetical protein